MGEREGVRVAGMGIVNENANFHNSETDFPPGSKKCLCGEKIRCLKKKGSNGFSSALNTYETSRIHSHMAVAQLSHLNCEDSGWLCLSQAGISTERRYSYMFLFAY